MLLYSLIVLLNVAIFANSEINEVCKETDRFHILTHYSQEDCSDKQQLFQNEIGGCFPACVELSDGLTTDGDKYPNFECSFEGKTRCPPGYTCEAIEVTRLKAPRDEPVFDNYCKLDLNSCFKYTTNYPDKDNPYKDAYWKPECLDDGTWAARQCKGEISNGRCFCYDAFGHRLPGHQWSTKAENMTCACSRKKAELQLDPNNWFVSLHCDDEGNYEELQCNQGQCWCVRPQTGDVVSDIVPESMWTILPCYKLEVYGEVYMRQCESHLYAQTKLVRELTIHGTTGYKFEPLLCDGDGSYGAYKIADGRATCVWKDNLPLGSWVLDLASNDQDLSDMDCYCARDSKIFALAGQLQNLKCLNIGNYDPLQSTTIDGVKKYFCVDADGFQKSEVLDDKPDCTKFK